MSNESASIDERIRSLVAQTRPWLVDSGLLPGLSDAAVDAKSEVICTFATLCAPASATNRGHRLAAQLTGVFFFLDDAEPDVLRSTILEMIPVLRDGEPPAAPSGPAAAFFEYLGEIATLGPAHWFKGQFLAFLEALLDEVDLLARGPLSMDGYLALRHRVIFVEEYIWTWLLSERQPTDGACVRDTALLRRTASEVVYLVNDLGSVERERAEGGVDPNLVFLLEREQGCSETDAVAQVVRRHDDAVARYAEERASLLRYRASPAVEAMIGVLDDTLHGNLATTLRLVASRYPGAADALGQLCAYPTRLRGPAPTYL